jgi:phosphotransferase system  glucose/maltose/N-acetylglucosamine-specific IIC component
MNAAIVLFYCLFCLVVSGVAMRYLRTMWVYFIVSATLPPMVLLAADALWRGYIDTWAGIGFIVAWLTALGCAFVYYFVMRLAHKRDRAKSETGGPVSS